MLSTRSRILLFALPAALCIGLIPEAALAQTASCPSSAQHILGTIICRFMDTLNSTLTQILSQVYGKMGTLAKLIATLYVLIYGLQVLAGTAGFTVREGAGRAVKLAIVVGLMTGGGSVNMSTVSTFFNSLALDVPSYILNTSSFPNDGRLDVSSSGGSLPGRLYTSIDALFYGFITSGLSLNTSFKLFGFLGSLAIFSPPLFFLVAGWIFEAFLLLVRSLVGILMSLAAIMFLVSLGPIFVGFLLFQTTQSIFESWLRHLISHALQVVFIFAALVMWVSVLSRYAGPISMLNDSIQPYSSIHSAASPNAGATEGWGLCKDSAGGGGGGGSATGPSLDSCNSGSEIIPASAVLLQPKFMYFFIYYVIALLALTHGFSGLIGAAPGIAQQLAGASGGGGALGGAGLSGFSNLEYHHKRASPQSAGSNKGSGASANLGREIADMVTPPRKGPK